jgi:hypothetical protein
MMKVGQLQLIRNTLISFEIFLNFNSRLLRNVLSQYGFRFLDVNCQQNLSAKFDIIQANLVVRLFFFVFD